MKAKYAVIILLLALLGFIIKLMIGTGISSTETSLEKIEVTVEIPAPPLLPNIPPEQLRQLADESEVKFTAKGNYFTISNKHESKELFIKGVNLGVAMPGYYPSQFSMDRKDYLNWFNLISRMNANTVRIYTVLPPDFYEALSQFNYEHSNRPLYLVQGVWIDDPATETYSQSISVENFRKEISKAIDVIHGKAFVLKKAGCADGIYSTDVSQYVIALVLGHEWDPKFIAKTNLEAVKKHSIKQNFNHHGNFITLHSGTPMECWLAEMIDFTATYEISKYRSQRPLSFINWQALDPMFHNQEYSRRNGHDYDGESIDMRKFHTTNLFRAGLFAAVHAYPYFPDFVYLESKYRNSVNRNGQKDSYKAYLEDFKRNLPDIPMLVAEYGLSSSRGNSRFNPDGFHQGSHSEAEQAELTKTLTCDIYDTKCAGALFFEWADEWFKQNWLTQKMEQPTDRIIYWHNRENPEQNYGIMAFEAKGKTIDGSTDDWKDELAINGFTMIYDADPAYLNFAFKVPGFTPIHNELLLKLTPETDHNIDMSSEILIKLKGKNESVVTVNGRLLNHQLNDESQNVFGEKPSPVFYEQGRLKYGNTKDSLQSNSDWYFDSANSVIELRIPWNLLNICDPSSRSIMADSIPLEIKGFNLSAMINDKNGKTKSIYPKKGSEFITWDKWDEPVYQTRLKPIYHMFKNLLPTLTPVSAARNIAPQKPSAKVLPYRGGAPGAVTIEFDGSLFSDIKDALPYLAEFRFRADFHIFNESVAKSASAVPIKKFTIEEIDSIFQAGHDTISGTHNRSGAFFRNIAADSFSSLHSLDSFVTEAKGKWVQINYSSILKDVNHSVFHRQLRILRNSYFWIAPSKEIQSYINTVNNSRLQTTINDSHTSSVTLKTNKNLNHELIPISIEYTGNGRKINVTGSAADGIYELRNGKVILEIIPNKVTTIEVIIQ
ncbi:MAG: hypothetical protein JNL74_19170 [Fibrobacteres bacterium]|nr:hypothetical protein [Fibrobacterota bacterium]